MAQKKQATPKKAASTKKTAKKATRGTPKKAAAKKAPAKNVAARKAPTKKAPIKKVAAKKAPTRKAAAVQVEATSPGWSAIDAACARIHGEAPLVHFTPKAAHVGGDPLEGISAFPCDRGGAHWHYVTYGFSDLHEKSTDDPASSGYGFELTFRLRRGDEAEPPVWPCDILQNFAGYVFRTGHAFGPGHHVPLNGPGSKLAAVAFALDPELGVVDTPFGAVEFLQVVGITRDEADAIRRWSSSGMLELLAARDPMLVTEVGRASLLADAETRRLIEQRTAAEGSSSSASFTTKLGFSHGDDGVLLRIGAIAVDDLVTQLAGRIPYGRDFALLGHGNMVSFRPSDRAGFSLDSAELVVDVPSTLAREITERVHPIRGIYRFDSLPTLAIEVVPVEIRDEDGNVTSVLG